MRIIGTCTKSRNFRRVFGDSEDIVKSQTSLLISSRNRQKCGNISKMFLQPLTDAITFAMERLPIS